MSLMLAEIHEQPTVFQRLLDGKPAELARLRRRFARDRPKLIVLAARGTSDNAALFARYLFEIALGIPTCLAAPSIATLYQTLPRLEQALVVGISQSGESTDINQYLARARQGGAFTVGITNESGSSIVDCADETLYLQAGKETSVAATKTYGAELLMAYLLAQALGASIPDSALGSLPRLADLQLRQGALGAPVGRPLPPHGPSRCTRARAKLRQRSRVCAQAHGDELRRRRPASRAPISRMDRLR